MPTDTPGPHPFRTVAALGTAQTVAWASSYYLPAMLAVPIARDLGITTPTVFAAFSLALIVSALVGPWSGHLIDRHGGRPVLMGTNLVFIAGLITLSFAQGPVSLSAAWIVLGIGMGSGLYEAAFSALVYLYRHRARNVITGITLIAGFASTVGWPLTTLLETQFGWRTTCLAWAALHLLIALPLNFSLPRTRIEPAASAPGDAANSGSPSAEPVVARPVFTGVLLALVFAFGWFIATAMAAHLPRLMQEAGATLAVAVAVGALVGPAQVGGRLLEFGVLRHVHPLLSARLAACAHPAGVVLLMVFGAPVAAVFAILHGAGNGILTIAKGTLPLVFFGPQGYGARQGWMMMPARASQALAPFVFGIVVDRWGAGALWLSAALGLMAFIALMLLPSHAPAEPGVVAHR
jgi:MFS family permease